MIRITASPGWDSEKLRQRQAPIPSVIRIDSEKLRQQHIPSVIRIDSEKRHIPSMFRITASPGSFLFAWLGLDSEKLR